MYCPRLECRRTEILLYIPEKNKSLSTRFLTMLPPKECYLRVFPSILLSQVILDTLFQQGVGDSKGIPSFHIILKSKKESGMKGMEQSEPKTREALFRKRKNLKRPYNFEFIKIKLETLIEIMLTG